MVEGSYPKGVQITAEDEVMQFNNKLDLEVPFRKSQLTSADHMFIQNFHVLSLYLSH